MIPRIWSTMARILVFYLFVQWAEAGSPTEERLLMRLRDEERMQSPLKDAVLLDDPSGDRSRRQLPTEINIQVTAPLFTARLYDFGTSDGDKEVPPSIDVGIKFELKQPLTFYDQKLNEIYILSNGGIGFEPNSRNYKSDIFHGGPMLIAPLWNRNDLRKGGKIYYREVTEGRAIERAQSEVRYQYDKNIKPTSVLLVTWEHMQPMGDQNLSEENSNTFQAAIISSDNGTFANFIFKSIGWTQGAEAGFSKGDSKNFYSLPTSGTSNIMYLKENGNTGIPGEWMFEIGQPKMIRCKPGVKGDTCDEVCADYEYGHDCEKCCHCGKGRCDVHTGECPGECKQCWKNAPHCDKRESDCKVKAKECGYNAISFTDYDKCGEAVVRCQCLSGYTGDGYNCTDVDECAKPNTCSPAANCYNTPGRYYCECQNGFKGNGTVCTAVDGASPSAPSGGISISTGNRSAVSPPASGQSPAASVVTTPATTQATTPEEPVTQHDTTPTRETGATTPLAPGLGIQLITAGTTVSSTSTTPTSTPTTPTPPSSAPPGSTPQPSTPLGSTPNTLPPAPQPDATTVKSASLVPEIIKATSPKAQYPDAVQTLPKETYSQISYRLRQPMNIFGKRRDHLAISSTGLVSLDDVPTVTPDDDLDQLGVSGFAPFFGKIDLGQRGLGAVTVRETSHSFVLTEATTLVDNYFHAPGFMAKSVLTISFDNVTNAARQEKNNFQIVLIAGNNALGENVTYVEYVYSNLQWSEGAQAVILADNSANTVQLPGSGSDGVRQLSQLSNIDEPGQWMYRVDLERVTCPQSNLLPPYCNSDTPAPTSAAPATRPAASASSQHPTGGVVVAVNHTGTGTIRPGTTPFISFTDEGDETITFPAFVTVLPQLITQNTQPPRLGSAVPKVEGGSGVPLPPPTLAITLRTETPVGSKPVTSRPALPVTPGPPQPPANTGDNTAPGSVPRPPSATLPVALPPSPATIAAPPGPSVVITPTETVPVIRNFSIPVGHKIPRPEPPTPVLPTLQPPPFLPPNISSPGPFLATVATLAATVPTAPAPVTLATLPGPSTPAPPVPNATLPPSPANTTHIKVANATPGLQPAPSNESHILVPTVEFGVITSPATPVLNVTGEDSSANLPPLLLFTTPKRQTRPPVPTRPPPRIVTATQGPNGPQQPPKRPPPPIDNRIDDNSVVGGSDELDSLNSPSKLAIIIPTAIVGVWLLLLMLIGIVVCCKRRSSRRRMRSKYDPGYHFRHMPTISATPRTKEAAAVAAAAAAASTSAQTNGVYPQPHVTYEDHLEKAARLSEMSQYGQNGGRVSMYGSYWNMPSSNRQYSYYNQGYYESCPEFNRTSYYNGRY